MTPVSGTIVGAKYRLERELAAGGMGAVWIARHVELDVDVAVKLMAPRVLTSPKSLERFRREARSAARLRHPGVVHIYDYGVDGETPYIAMELLEGEDLRSVMAKQAPFPPARVLGMLRPVMKVLDVAHRAGLVHRDLKPANIFIARTEGEESVKVLDFGIAKDLRPELSTAATESDLLLGTPAYMSPEQARGDDVDARSDLWSLGVIVLEMMTGTNPFQGTTLGQVFGKIGWEPLPRPSALRPGLPLHFDELMSRVLVRDRDKRIPSAAAFAVALEAVVGGDAVPDLSAFEAPRRLPDDTLATSRSVGRQDPTAELTPSAPPDLAHAPTVESEPGFLAKDHTAPPSVTASTPAQATVLRRPSRGSIAAVAFGLAAVAVVVVVWSGSGGSDDRAESPTASPPPAADEGAPIGDVRADDRGSAERSAALPEPSVELQASPTSSSSAPPPPGSAAVGAAPLPAAPVAPKKYPPAVAVGAGAAPPAPAPSPVPSAQPPPNGSAPVDPVFGL